MILCINARKCGMSVLRIASQSIPSGTAISVLVVLLSIVISTHILISRGFLTIKPFTLIF